MASDVDEPGPSKPHLPDVSSSQGTDNDSNAGCDTVDSTGSAKSNRKKKVLTPGQEAQRERRLIGNMTDAEKVEQRAKWKEDGRKRREREKLKKLAAAGGSAEFKVPQLVEGTPDDPSVERRNSLPDSSMDEAGFRSMEGSRDDPTSDAKKRKSARREQNRVNNAALRERKKAEKGVPDGPVDKDAERLKELKKEQNARARLKTREKKEMSSQESQNSQSDEEPSTSFATPSQRPTRPPKKSAPSKLPTTSSSTPASHRDSRMSSHTPSQSCTPASFAQEPEDLPSTSSLATPVNRRRKIRDTQTPASSAKTPSAGLSMDMDALGLSSQGESHDEEPTAKKPLRFRHHPDNSTKYPRKNLFRRPDETLEEFHSRDWRNNGDIALIESDGDEDAMDTWDGRSEDGDGDHEMDAESDCSVIGDADMADLTARRAARDEPSRKRERRALNKMKSKRMTPKQTDFTDVSNLVPDVCSLGPISCCNDCGAYTFNPRKCCAKGKVRIPPFVPQPLYIRKLITGSEKKNKHVQQHVVKYNSSIAMGAMSYHRADTERCKPYMRVNGQMHCKVSGSSVREGKTTPMFHQLYKYDANEATKHRMQNLVTAPFIKPNIVRNLHMVMEESNHLVRQYTMASEIFADMVKNNEPLRNVFVQLRSPDEVHFSGQAHRGCFTRPRRELQSAIYTTEEDGGPGIMDVILKHRNFGGHLESIGYFNPLIDPLQYPLIHAYGQPGYKRKVYKLGVNYVPEFPDLEYEQREVDDEAHYNPFPFELVDDEMDPVENTVDYESAMKKHKEYRRASGEDVSSSSEDDTEEIERLLEDLPPGAEDDGEVLNLESDDEPGAEAPHYFLDYSATADEPVLDFADDVDAIVGPHMFAKDPVDEGTAAVVEEKMEETTVPDLPPPKETSIPDARLKKEDWKRKEKELQAFVLKKESQLVVKAQKLKQFKDHCLRMRSNTSYLERLFKDNTEIRNLDLDLDFLDRTKYQKKQYLWSLARVVLVKSPHEMLRDYADDDIDCSKLQRDIDFEIELLRQDPEHRKEEPNAVYFRMYYLSPSQQDDNMESEDEEFEAVQKEVGTKMKEKEAKKVKPVRSNGGPLTWVTRRHYVQHQMQVRDRSFHPILSTGNLGQLYVIDQCHRIIRNRNDNERSNLIRLRGSNEDSLSFAKHSKAAERKGFKLGYSFELSNKRVQSVAWYREQFENAMAVMDACGKPDLFITMTGDPDWPEIVDNLLPDSTWQDNPFLVNDVFHMKMQEVLADIVEKELFGPVVAHCYSIEFQKRGMPHMHLLVTLKDGFKLDTSDKIDRYISAKLPPVPDQQDRQFDLKMRFRNNVIDKMVHSACIGDPNSYCNSRPMNASDRVYDRCTKMFPYPFNTHTSTTDGGKVSYHRPEDGVFCTKIVNKKEVFADNRYVVPYNPFLLNKYSCHINVEAVTQTDVVKYIYKYIYKGVDKALAQFIESYQMDDGAAGLPPRTSLHVSKDGTTGVLAPRGMDAKKEYWREMIDRVNKILFKYGQKKSPDEKVTAYDEAILVEVFRQMTASEAAWITTGYWLSHLSHVVVNLSVHVEGQMPVFFRPGEEEQARQKVADGRTKSKLVAWFDLNKRDRDARAYTFNEIPLHYTFEKDSTKCEWKKYTYNMEERNIVRVRPVSPRFLEQFSVRLLVMHQRGPQSFEELRTVDGKLYATNHDAAKALGLIDSQVEFDVCLAEAVDFCFPNRLRMLFATMLIFGDVKDPKYLWEKYETEFYDKRYRNDPVRGRQAALYHIQYFLTEHGRLLTDFHLPDISNSRVRLTQTEIDTILDGAVMATPDDLDEESKKMVKTLNPEQLDAFNTIVRAVQTNGRYGSCFFLQGSGGCGKTYVYRAIYYWLKSKDVPVSMIATTGIAATLLIHGTTAHRKFMLPLNCTSGSTSNMRLETQPAIELAETAVFIIDESTMASRFNFQAIDKLLREVTGCKNKPFGGKIMLLGGDWKQLLPVVPGGSSSDAAMVTLKRDPLWESFKVLTLQKNMRAHKDPKYATLLENVGNGLMNGEADLKVRLDPGCICSSMEDVIDFIYPDMNADPKEIAQSCVLASLNDETTVINDLVLSRMNGVPKVYRAIDTPRAGIGMQVCPEYFMEEMHSGMPPFELTLKVGAIVILLRNICVSKGLCNGSRLRIVEMHQTFVECELLTTDFAGSRVWIGKMNTDPPTNGKRNANYTRFQLPLRLAYAMTINKSQGQTFDRVGIILKNNVFSHGQLYVALSRARESAKVRLFSASRGFVDDRAVVVVRNLVDRTILEPIPDGSLKDPDYVEPLPVFLYEEKIKFKKTPGRQFVHDNSRPQSDYFMKIQKHNQLKE